jgi:hypothetical protein
MKKTKLFSKTTEPPFFKDIEKDGYHIYNLNNAKTPGYYPPELPHYPGVNRDDLRVDDVVIIRVFFGIGTGKHMRIDGGLLCLKIELVEKDEILGAVLTQLPKEFSIQTGSTIELYLEEILYKTEIQ